MGPLLNARDGYPGGGALENWIGANMSIECITPVAIVERKRCVAIAQTFVLHYSNVWS